jgi:uncharacterized membrane protein YdjX (TVP38/TMEM64 family)
MRPPHHDVDGAVTAPYMGKISLKMWLRYVAVQLEETREEMSCATQWARIGAALGIVAITGVGIAATPLGWQLWQLLIQPSPERLSQVLPGSALWLALALIALMVLHTLVPLPAELLGFVAGMALGPWWGSLTIWLGAILGAALGFYLARFLGRPFLIHVVSLRRLDGWLSRLQDMDAVYLVAVRLLPIISFNLINYTLGLSPIGWWRFFWTTSVGIVPLTILAVVFGAYLQDWRVLMLLTGSACVVALSGYGLLRRRKKTVLS